MANYLIMPLMVLPSRCMYIFLFEMKINVFYICLNGCGFFLKLCSFGSCSHHLLLWLNILYCF